MIDRMDNEKLIQEISKHEELFDTKHKNYFDSDMKNGIWNEISLKVNYKPEICKARWRNLRTCFVSEIKKADKYSRIGKKTKKYIYYDKMTFLLPYLQYRKITSRENSKALVPAENSNIHNEYDYENSQLHSKETAKEFIDLSAAFIDQDQNAQTQDQDPILVEETHMDIENERIETEYKNKEEKDDPLKMFFTTMYKTVKGFPPHLQLNSKKAIFNVVTNFEEKLLQQSTNYCNRNTS